MAQQSAGIAACHVTLWSARYFRRGGLTGNLVLIGWCDTQATRRHLFRKESIWIP